MSWTRLERRTVYSTNHLTVYEDTVRVNDTTVIDDYSVVKFKDVVLVFATTPEGELLAFKEYRYAVDEYMLNIPAGTFDAETEQPLEAAARELAEETGYIAENMELVTTLHDYPTKCPHTVFVVRAYNVKKVSEPHLESTEEMGELLFLSKDYKEKYGSFRTTNILAGLAVVLPEFV